MAALRWDGLSESIDEQAASERLAMAAQKVVLSADMIASFDPVVSLRELNDAWREGFRSTFCSMKGTKVAH